MTAVAAVFWMAHDFHITIFEVAFSPPSLTTPYTNTLQLRTLDSINNRTASTHSSQENALSVFTSPSKALGLLVFYFAYVALVVYTTRAPSPKSSPANQHRLSSLVADGGLHRGPSIHPEWGNDDASVDPSTDMQAPLVKGSEREPASEEENEDEVGSGRPPVRTLCTPFRWT